MIDGLCKAAVETHIPGQHARNPSDRRNRCSGTTCSQVYGIDRPVLSRRMTIMLTNPSQPSQTAVDTLSEFSLEMPNLSVLSNLQRCQMSHWSKANKTARRTSTEHSRESMEPGSIPMASLLAKRTSSSTVSVPMRSQGMKASSTTSMLPQTMP